MWRATAALFSTGLPLMARVLPTTGPVDAWAHYPPGDVVNGPLQARWFYHSHNPGDRVAAEHGHFHLFVGRRAFSRRVQPLIAPPAGRRPRPALVHIAGLAIDRRGVPLAWLAPNRWVTDEWLYPAAAIVALIPRLSFDGPQGDPLVNRWLAEMLRASQRPIAAMLERRDHGLIHLDPSGEDRAIEIVAQAGIDLDALIGGKAARNP